MTDYTSYLKRVPLFAQMSEAHLQRIANSARERHFEPRAAIISEGETGHGFYLIVKGEARVERSGRARAVATLSPGDYFGELALLRDEPRSATVVAVLPTTCLMLTRWDFKGILEANPSMAIRLLETVASRIQGEDTR